MDCTAFDLISAHTLTSAQSIRFWAKNDIIISARAFSDRYPLLINLCSGDKLERRSCIVRMRNMLGTSNLLFLSNVVSSRSGNSDVVIRNICLSFKNQLRVNVPCWMFILHMPCKYSY